MNSPNIKKMGRRQKKAFSFISQLEGWHSFAKDSKSVVVALEKRNLVDVDLETNQYRLR